jgi:putative tryptophan/tyrosine transport system substrate-binding protein
MRRREFITLAGGAAAWPLTGLAQEAGKVRRIGFLRVGEPPAAFIDGFRRGLREVGLVEGRDFVIKVKRHHDPCIIAYRRYRPMSE